MNKILTLCVFTILLDVTACQKVDDKPAQGSNAAVPGMTVPPADDAEERARIRRPPPATIGGFNSDKNNPNGVPGPSSGIGTSPNRY